jgi:hypothetical protein
LRFTIKTTISYRILAKGDDAYNRSLIADSLRNADCILIRAHGGHNRQNCFMGFEDKEGITYINLSDIKHELSRAGGTIRTKMIFADTCTSGNVKDEKFLDALREKGLVYIGSKVAQCATNSPLKFISDYAQGQDMESNLDELNDDSKGYFIKLP